MIKQRRAGFQRIGHRCNIDLDQQIAGASVVVRLVRDIARDVMGLGPIEQFLNDPAVNEVMVNGCEHIYVERHGVIEQTKVRFTSEDHLRRVIERIVSSVGFMATIARPPLVRVRGRAGRGFRRCRNYLEFARDRLIELFA